MGGHVLKCWPNYFQAIVEGRKNFEVRYDDRGFQAGDKVTLREYDPNGLTESSSYSGREIEATIGYVLHNTPPRSAEALVPGYVAFSLLDLKFIGGGGRWK